MKNCYSGEQPNTEALYKNVFDKSSEFRAWGLLPVDEIRKFDSQNDPVRLYDSSLDKTIFLNMPRPLAGVLDELYKKHYIGNFAIRSCDFYIYDGVNCMGSLLEALEKGRIFLTKSFQNMFFPLTNTRYCYKLIYCIIMDRYAIFVM